MMVTLMVNACMQNEGENDGEFVVELVHSMSYVHASKVVGYLYPMKVIEYFVFKMKVIKYFVFKMKVIMMLFLHHEVTTLLVNGTTCI